jgi:hypothetical protein
MKSTLIMGMSLMASFAIAQSTRPAYAVMDLGPVGGPPGTPYFIANNGLIAGAAGDAGNQSHAEIWFLGLKFDLATPGLGGLNSIANAVNEKGQVVGAAQTAFVNSEDFCGFNAYGVRHRSPVASRSRGRTA